jgi:hypothetical protein
MIVFLVPDCALVRVSGTLSACDVASVIAEVSRFFEIQLSIPTAHGTLGDRIGLG